MRTVRTDSTSWMAAAQVIVEAISPLVDQLIASRPGKVHGEILALVERAMLARILLETRGNQVQAARLLGINRNTLHKYCRRFGLLPPRNGADGALRPTPTPAAAPPIGGRGGPGTPT